MQSNRTAKVTISALALMGVVCIAARAYSHRSAAAERADRIWRLTYDINLHANALPAAVRAASPVDSGHSRVFRREVQHPGLDSERQLSRTPDTTSREVRVTATRRGNYRLLCEFDLHVSRREAWTSANTTDGLGAEKRLSYLGSERLIPVNAPVVRETLSVLRGDRVSKLELLGRIHEYCVNEIVTGDDGAPEEAVSAIGDGVATVAGRARTLVVLCRQARIPARLVSGFVLPVATSRGGVSSMEEAELQPHVWAEAMVDKTWLPLDPEYDFKFTLPHSFVPVRVGSADVLRSSGVDQLEARFHVRELPPNHGLHKPGTAHNLADVFDLTRLPLEMHEPLALILLLPLGALVTAICRTIVGIQTFGIFTPALLAISFVYADGQTGLLVLPGALTLGLLGRRWVDTLRLLMVPRLSVILTLIVVTLVMGVSILDWLQITMSAQAVLLPMVILTTLVERLYITSEEDGVHACFRLCIGTLAVAFLCWLLLQWESIGRLLLAFPEAHLITVAGLVWIGRYHGYRLTELFRFRDLAVPKPAA